jgi:hypothetical protein
MARGYRPSSRNTNRGPDAMKICPFIASSLLLNAALAAAIVLAVKKLPSPLPPEAVATSIQENVPQPMPAAEDTPGTGRTFQWSQITSDDFKIYRDNLRAMGCPEATVREIIRAVINEDCLLQRRVILNSFQDHYWDLVMRQEMHKRQSLPKTEWGLSLTSLASKRQQLIADVLGPDALSTEVERQARRTDWERSLSWLSPGKRGQLIELEEKYWQQLDQASISGNEASLQKSQQEFEEAEKQLLTTEEMAELNLRGSDVAGWAASLQGFNPSEDEWRTLTDLRAQFEASQAALANANLSDEQIAAQQNELQSNFDNAIQGTLSPDRFAQYQLANNDQYQALHAVTQRYGLPDSVVQQGLSVQQTALASAEQVRANSTLSPADQQAALTAIQQETQQTLGQILGANVLSTYQEYGGDWLTGLGQISQ